MRIDDDEVLEDAPPHRRLHTVRTRLLAMDYNEPLGVESMDLVERMLMDLITTSESYEKIQQQEDRLSQDLALAQVREAGTLSLISIPTCRPRKMRVHAYR